MPVSASESIDFTEMKVSTILTTIFQKQNSSAEEEQSKELKVLLKSVGLNLRAAPLKEWGYPKYVLVS